MVFISSITLDPHTFSAPYFWDDKEETLVRDVPAVYKSLLFTGISIAVVRGTGIGISRGRWKDGTIKTFVVLEVGSDQNTI